MFARFAMAVAAVVLFCARPAFAAPPLEAYGGLPAMQAAALSASGEKIAVVGTAGGSQRVLVLGSDGRVQFDVVVQDIKVEELRWAGDDFVLVTFGGADKVRSLTYGFTFVGVINVKTRDLKFVFQTGAYRPIVFGHYGLVQVGGRWQGYFAGIAQNAEPGDPPDLFKVDLETARAEPLRNGGDMGVYRDWLIDGRGEVAAVADYLFQGSWRLSVADQPIIRESDPLAEYSLEGLGRTPDTVVYSRLGERGREWLEVNAKSPSEGVVLFDGQASLWAVFDPHTRLLVGTVKSGEFPAYQLIDPARQAKVRMLERALAGYRIHLVSWSADFSKAIAFTDGLNDSGTYWVIDFATGKASELGYAYPAVKEGDVGASRLVAYKAADGLTLQGVLTLPPGVEAKNLPVVVLPHGGPDAHDEPGFDWLAQAFASRGYAVLQPNYRGSSGYGQALVDAAAGQVGRKMQTDVSDAISHLAAEGLVDPKRACIVGLSFGGYTALAGVTLQKGVYRCAVSYSGVFNLPKMTEAATAARRYWINLAGAPPQMRQVSPSERADEADAPVLLIHGKLDTVVPVEQSREMERALKRAGKPVQLIELEGEDHYLSMTKTRTAMLKAAVEFVEKHNPPR